MAKELTPADLAKQRAELTALTADLREQKKATQELKDLRLKASDEHHDALKLEASLLEKSLVEATKKHKQEELELSLRKEKLDLLRREAAALEALSNKGKDELARLSALRGTINAERTAVAELTVEFEKNARVMTKMTKETDAAKTASSKFRQGIGSLTTSIVGYRGGLGKAMSTTDGFKHAMHGLGTAIGSVFTISGVIDLFASFANVMVQAVLDIDNTRLALVQATGASEDLQEAMYELRAETMGLNISGAELAQGLIALRTGMRDFDKLTTDSKKSMASMATQLDKLGLAFEDQTRIMQFMNVTMGQTMMEARQTVKELYNMTAAAGKGPKELAADFQAAAPMLSVYGKKMRHEFTMMAAASRETGIEMSKLMGIVGTMDTFEGAADLAGTMNAFLGGPYLNTVELVSMTEQERLIAIKRSMVASGRSFKQMSRYQQKGIAKSLNMDLAEANALFSSSERAIRGRSRAMEIAAKREMDYKKKIQESLPVMQALQAGFKELGMAMIGALLGTGPNTGPAEMVEMISKKVQEFKKGIPDLIDKIKGLARTIITVLVGIAMVSWGLSLVKMAVAYKVLTAAAIASSGTQIAAAKATGLAWLKAGSMAKRAGKMGLAAGGVIGGLMGAKAATDSKKSFGSRLLGGVGAVTSAVGAGMMFVPGMQGIGMAAMGLGGLAGMGATMMDDFIYRGDGSAKGATIQPINKNDSFVGVKPGGGMDHNMSAMLAELRKLNRAQSENSAALRELAEKTGKMQINMDSRKVGEAVSSTVIRKINRRGT